MVSFLQQPDLPLAMPLFLLIFSILALVPLIHAWRAARSDDAAGAAPVLRAGVSSFDFSANTFRRQVLIDGATRRALSVSLFEYIRVPIEQLNWQAARRPLISSIGLRLREAIRCGPPLFVHSNLRVDHGSRFNALLATGTIHLGPQCEIHQWAHADGVLQLGSHGIGLRRLSSNIAVELDTGCLFERISAPTVRFGQQPMAAAAVRTPPRADLADLPRSRRSGMSRYHIDGDCRLLPDRLYAGSLTVSGDLMIGDGTVVLGDMKAQGSISVGRNARIGGALACVGEIEVRQGAWVHGPIVTETSVVLATGTRVGIPKKRTGINAATIIAETGATVHGTVLAREAGLVWQA